MDERGKKKLEEEIVDDYPLEEIHATNTRDLLIGIKTSTYKHLMPYCFPYIYLFTCVCNKNVK